ncbi:MAG: S-layer homology domain-containing protein [Clostridia bacterium]|nr:S-layer homology domain-containing protein [Clostridia bacterium]
MKTKRIICSILCVLMLITLIPVTVSAENGPFIDEEFSMAYGAFFKTDENGQVISDVEGEPEAVWFFRQGKAQASTPDGIDYDLATNTLTITNIDMTSYLLETVMMGDDFKVVVKGNCGIGSIAVFDWSWGGSLDIEGDGTLTVNKNKVFDHAVKFTPEKAENIFFKLGSNVNVNLYAKTDRVVAVYRDVDPDSFFLFANCKPETARVQHVFVGEKHTSGFFIDEDSTSSGYIKCTSATDPEGLYGATKFFQEIDEYTEPIYLGWWVYKYVYSEKFGRYFQDYSFGEGGNLEFTLEEFEQSGYKIEYDEYNNEIWNDFNSPWIYSSYEDVYADKDGNEYVIFTHYDDNGPDRVTVCAIEPIPELPGENVFKAVSGVDPDDLEKVIAEQTSDTYDIVIPGSEFIYKAGKFIDVPPDAWFAKAALWCSERGFITGTSDNTFSPNVNLTRAMFVQILARVAGANLDEITYKGKFTDVTADKWYAKAVQWAVDNNITSGISDTSFAPDAQVTREQLAVFFYAYSKSNEYDVSASDDLARFTDVDMISSWALTAIRWAVAEGLISGMTDTTIGPKGYATRAQAAVIFKNYVEIYSAKQK